MATVEQPQPMDVDPKKADEKTEEKNELVSEIFFCRVIISEIWVLRWSTEIVQLSCCAIDEFTASLQPQEVLNDLFNWKLCNSWANPKLLFVFV